MKQRLKRFLPLTVVLSSLMVACGGGDEEFTQEWNATLEHGECIPLDQLQNREEAEKYPACK